MTILGCIADDFTGATDIAGLLARSGVRVRLHTGLPSSEPDNDNAAFEVIALKIRTAPVEEAVAEACAALDWLRRAGASRFFWKYCSTFDSTKTGNIGPVSEALMAALGIDRTIYCPAFPENGRRVFMGNLFVHQQPLAESPMKDHPLTPMRDSNVMRLLAPQVSSPVALADMTFVAQGADALRTRIDTLFAQGAGHVVVDAIDNDSLGIVAEACREMALMTGGSALAMPLPGLYIKDGTLSADADRLIIPSLAAGAVILSGSASSMTNLQVANYLARGGEALQLDPLDLADNGHQSALDWLSKQDLKRAPLVYATAQPESVRAVQARLGVERAGAIVEEALAALAIHARDLGVGRIVVAGGETSGAVTRALEVQNMEIGPEIAPGVPWCFCVSNKRQIGLTLKSGNFGKETFFADALGMLGG
jgi:3-dehydrotetronate 4-kinase